MIRRTSSASAQIMQAGFEKSLAKLRRANAGVARRTARKEIDEAIRAARRK